VDKTSTPSLLPIFRSQQQAELLALILGDATAEHTMTDLAGRTGIPYPSVHREIERALAVGLVSERLVGRTRVVRADTTSPYFDGLSDVLVRAFGVPWVIREALKGIGGIAAAYIYGSWAARYLGIDGQRPVGDIDLLVLGNPNRKMVYAAASSVETRLGRPVQVTIRSADWLTDGSGTFHDTVSSRPLVPVSLASIEKAQEDSVPRVAPRRRQQPVKLPVPRANRPR
jgi:predicted nucleotidyltransferase